MKDGRAEGDLRQGVKSSYHLQKYENNVEPAMHKALGDGKRREDGTREWKRNTKKCLAEHNLNIRYQVQLDRKYENKDIFCETDNVL